LHARRLYIGGIPGTVLEENIVKYLNQKLIQAKGTLDPGDPILKSVNNPEKRYIFLELRSLEETSALIQLDGIRYNESTLRIRRPPDYEKFPPIKPRRPVPIIDTVSLGIISTKVEDGPNKIFIGGLPKEFSEDQIKNLLLRYGTLKSFHLVKDAKEESSKGFAFCEFLDDRGVKNALNCLNGMKIGNRTINVRKSGQSSYMMQQAQMSEEERRQFEEKLHPFIENCSRLMGGVGVLGSDFYSRKQPLIDDLE